MINQEFKFYLKTFFSEIQEDRVITGGAALAFYLTLAVFPAMIACLAVLSYIPVDGLDKLLFDKIHQYMPVDLGKLLIKILQQAITTKNPALVSTGFIGVLWATSSGMGAAIEQLNVVYDVKKQRHFITHRLLAIGLTMLYLALVALASTIIVASQSLQLSSIGTPLSGLVDMIENALSYAASFAILLFSFGLMYYVAPNTKLKFKFITPGGLAGSIILIIAAIVFDYSFDNTYGSIASFIILMLWLYVASFVLLLGAEINSVYRDHTKSKKALPDI